MLFPEKNEAPHSRAVGYLMSQATEVALTMASPGYDGSISGCISGRCLGDSVK